MTTQPPPRSVLVPLPVDALAPGQFGRAPNLGKTIRAVRHRLGLTQREFGALLGLPDDPNASADQCNASRTVGRWERGSHAPCLRSIGRILRVAEPDLRADLIDAMADLR